MRYEDMIPLDPDTLTIGDANSIIEMLRGLGTADLHPDYITFTIDTSDLTDIPDDLWSLRDLLAEIEIELNSRGINYTADREKVTA